MHDTGTSESYPIELDKILNTGTIASPTHEGLAHSKAYRFRVGAEFTLSGDKKTFFSTPIVVIDSPIVAANGAGSNGQAALTWDEVEGADVLSNPDYEDGTYSFRYRKFDIYTTVDDMGNPLDVDHTDHRWKAENFAPAAIDSGTMPITGSTHTITGLTLGDVYAIQLIYDVTPTGGDPIRVYAGRDVYVWPAAGQQDAGKRVATYPFSGYFPSKTYAYRVCKGTFPGNADDQNNWALLIKDALQRWQIATNDLITMSPDYDTTPGNGHIADSKPIYKPCTKFAPTTGDSALALYNDKDFRRLISKDNEISEILMVKPFTIDKWLKGSLFEMILVADPGKLCLAFDEKTIACASTSPSYATFLTEQHLDFNIFSTRVFSIESKASTPLVSSDILFNRKSFEIDQTVEPHRPSDVVFGVCRQNSVPRPNDGDLKKSRFVAYATAVHEAGHALGLATRNLDEIFRLGAYLSAHPSMPDAVMNYDKETGVLEPDCAPYPFDVLAIYALYQSVRVP